MAQLFALLQLVFVLFTVLALAFLVLLAIPASRLRDIVLPFVAWSIAALSVAYIFLPFDAAPEALFGPLGLIDDMFALVTAVGSGVVAMSSQKAAQKRMEADYTDYTKPSMN